MIYDGKSDQIVLLIKHRMLDLSIKQKDIVEQTGLAKSTVSNFLNGRTPSPSLDTIKQYCDAMECDLIIDIVPKQK